MREVQQPGERVGVFRAMVIVLRSDPASEVRKRMWTGLAIAPLLCAATWNQRSSENLAPMKEDLPWNRTYSHVAPALHAEVATHMETLFR
jgi:hypothetical protein